MSPANPPKQKSTCMKKSTAGFREWQMVGNMLLLAVLLLLTLARARALRLTSSLITGRRPSWMPSPKKTDSNSIQDINRQAAPHPWRRLFPGIKKPACPGNRVPVLCRLPGKAGLPVLAFCPVYFRSFNPMPARILCSFFELVSNIRPGHHLNRKRYILDRL